VVQGEKAANPQVTAVEDFLVQIGAKLLKIIQPAGHSSSGNAKSTSLNWESHYGLNSGFP
jgi:hypothetical protein